METNASSPTLLSSTGLGLGSGLGSGQGSGLGSGLGSGMVIGHGVIGRSFSASPRQLSPGLPPGISLSPNARDYLDAEAGNDKTPTQYNLVMYPLKALCAR